MKRLRSPLFIGGSIVGLFVVVAVLAPLLAPFDPQAITGDSLQAPSVHHFFGTNDIGQDIFSQVVWGSRASLVVALPAAALAVSVGVIVGVGIGLLGGLADFVSMRVIDVFLAMPTLPLLVLIVALMGPSRLTSMAILGLLGWPPIARTVRSQTLSLRQRGFISAATGFGGNRWYVMRRHLFPGLATVIVALFITLTAAAVFLESGLSFLGVADPTAVSWGQVLSRAVNQPGLFNTTGWVWWVVPPGMAVTLTVLGFSLLGMGLEPRFNPGSKRAS